MSTVPAGARPRADRVVAHAGSYGNHALERALDGVAAAGFRAVEVVARPGWFDGAEPRGLERALAAVAARGLRAACLSVAADLTTPGGRWRFGHALVAAAASGLTLVTTVVGGAGSPAQRRRAFYDGHDEIAAAVRRSGVTVALEVLGEVMPTGQHAAGLLAAVEDTPLRVKYDTGNCVYYAGVDPVDDLPHALAHLANVDLKDQAGGRGVFDFPALGRGELRFPAVLDVLAAAGYDGPLTVEIELTGDERPDPGEVDEAMAASYRYLRGLGLA